MRLPRPSRFAIVTLLLSLASGLFAAGCSSARPISPPAQEPIEKPAQQTILPHAQEPVQLLTQLTTHRPAQTHTQSPSPSPSPSKDLYFLTARGSGPTFADHELGRTGPDGKRIERDNRSQTIVFNELGETIERFTTPVVIWRVSATTLMIDAAHHDDPVKQRRVFTRDHSYNYHDDLIPVHIGNGILAFKPGFNPNIKPVRYMTSDLEPIDDIAHHVLTHFGYDIGEHLLVGFVGDSTIPVVQHDAEQADGHGQWIHRRIVLPDGSLSPEQVSVDHFILRSEAAIHHGLVTASTLGPYATRRTWIMDSTTGELLLEITKSGGLRANAEMLITRRLGDSTSSVFTPELEWVLQLPKGITLYQPTDDGLWICGVIPPDGKLADSTTRAMRVHLPNNPNPDNDPDNAPDNDRLEWIDHAPYTRIESLASAQWIRGWTARDTAVLLDASLNPVITLPRSQRFAWVSDGGLILCWKSNRHSALYGLYSKQGRLIRTFDSIDLFASPEPEPYRATVR